METTTTEVHLAYLYNNTLEQRRTNDDVRIHELIHELMKYPPPQT
jgi:hypothetical protein